MKKLSKGIIAGVLCIIMTASLFAGCSQKKDTSDNASVQNTTTNSKGTEKETDLYFNKEGMPIVNKPIEMSMLTVLNPNAPTVEDMKFFPRIEKLTNIKWKVELVQGAALQEKANLLLASGDYPDMFLKASISTNQEMAYGDQQGIFLPLEELIDKYAPNIKNTLDTVTNLRKTMTTPKGHIFSLPDLGEGGSTNHVFINTKWLKALGLKEPKNLADFYNILKAFKEKDPNGNGKADEWPISAIASSVNRELLQWLAYFGLIDNPANGLSLVDGKIAFSYVQPEYKKFVEFMAKLYKEGLLDPESFTQNDAQQKAKGSGDDAVLGSFYKAAAFLVVGSPRDQDYESLIPWVAENGKQAWPRYNPLSGAFVLTDKCKYPEAAIRWMDYFFTEEGRRLGWMGVEGEDYKMNADGSWGWILPDGMDIPKLRAEAGIQGMAACPVRLPDIWTKKIDEVSVKVEYDRDRVRPYDELQVPSLYISDENQKKLNAYWADIQPYVDQYLAKAVTGSIDLTTDWDNYVSTLKKMGEEEYIKIYQAAYDVYNSH